MVISSLTGGYNATNKCTQYKPLSVEWYKNSINIATLYTIGYHPDLYNKLANKNLPLICTNPLYSRCWPGSRSDESCDKSCKTQGCCHEKFKGVLRNIKECFKGVFRGFHGYLKENKREFQRSLKCVSRVIQGSFKGGPRKFLVCFKKVSRVLQEIFKWCFNGVLIKKISRVF